MNIIAVCIAVLGIAQDSISLIIASMILAPLVHPIFGIGLGIINKNWTLTFLSVKNTILYIFIIVVAGSILTFVIGLFITIDSGSYLGKETFHGITLFTSIFSGIASAYALSHDSLADSMAGVAIAVSLIPPLGASTIHLQGLDFGSLLVSLSTFGISIIGILIGTIGVFYCMNFTNSDEKELDKQVKEKALES